MDVFDVSLEHGCWGVHCSFAGRSYGKDCSDLYQFFRDVCSTCLLNDGPTLLGGDGEVVQIDESLFINKVKVCLQYNQTLVFTDNSSFL